MAQIRRVLRNPYLSRRNDRRKGNIRPEVPTLSMFVSIPFVQQDYGAYPDHITPNARPFRLMNHSSR
jgi:hypothetical protein